MKWRWKNTFFGTPDNKRDTTERVSIHFDENISFVVPTYVDEGQIQLDMRNISYENKTKWVKHYNSLNEDDATHRNAGSLPAHYNPDAGSNIMTKFDRDYVIDLLNELVSVCQ